MYGVICSEDPNSRVEHTHEVRLETEREKKWLKMLKQWDVSNDKLRRRVYKGIPNAVRGRVWSKLLGLETVKEEQRGKYQVRES